MQERRTVCSPQPQNVLAAWQEQVAEAARNPKLMQQLVKREHELLPRFAEYYKRLHALPRRVRRALQEVGEREGEEKEDIQQKNRKVRVRKGLSRGAISNYQLGYCGIK